MACGNRFNPRLNTRRMGDAGRSGARTAAAAAGCRSPVSGRRRRRWTDRPGHRGRAGHVAGRRTAGRRLLLGRLRRLADVRTPVATTAVRPARTPTPRPTAPGSRSRTPLRLLVDDPAEAVDGVDRSPGAEGRDLHWFHLHPAAARRRPTSGPSTARRPDDLPRHDVLRGRAAGTAARPERRLRRAPTFLPTSTATTSRTCSAPCRR